MSELRGSNQKTSGECKYILEQLITHPRNAQLEIPVICKKSVTSPLLDNVPLKSIDTS